MFDKLKKIVFGQPSVSQERSADHALDRLEEMLGSAKRKENSMLVFNTQPWAQWLVNYIETVLSSEVWKPTTVATIAGVFRTILDVFAARTGGQLEFTSWQGHDFALRGLSGLDDGSRTGVGHLTYFTGTDNIPSVERVNQQYRGEETFVGGSVPATEHSVMTMGGEEGEFDIIKRIITEVNPFGIVSLVLDGYNYWNAVAVSLPALKEEILSRGADAFGNSKVVVRPDSGNPVKIITGTIYYATKAQESYTDEMALSRIKHEHATMPAFKVNGAFDTHIYWRGKYWPINGGPVLEEPTPEMLGTVAVLAKTFGYELNAAGFKRLSTRVGWIYGDSITMDRCVAILYRLWFQGWESTSGVFGIGSYSYQFITRDTLGQAMKTTFAIVGGEERVIQKNPATDSGTKKSARGALAVKRTIDVDGNSNWILVEDVPPEEIGGDMECAFYDGRIYTNTSIAEMRLRSKQSLAKHALELLS